MIDKSQISIQSDSSTAATSSAMGANINALAFNIDLIAQKNPNLAIEILKLYEKAKAIKPNDPAGPEEDFSLALEQLGKVLD